jgi:hypothetical protein
LEKLKIFFTFNPLQIMDTTQPIPSTSNDEKAYKRHVRQLTKLILKVKPSSKETRFRYECESRTAGSIKGENSTENQKTYPTIQIEGYKGPALVIVSCLDSKSYQ